MLVETATMYEFRDFLAKSKVAVVPFGSVEEHGHHLPLNTDTAQVVKTAEMAQDHADFFLMPPVHYGYCRSTREHPGTVGISPATLRALVFDIGQSLYSQGVRGIIFISGHAGKGHMAAIEESAQDLVDKLDGLIAAVVCEYHWAVEAGKTGLVETKDDGHAGEVETSRILVLDTGLVKGSSPEEYPNFPTPLILREKLSAWPGGVWGDPGKATPDKGREIYEITAKRLAQLVVEMNERLVK